MKKYRFLCTREQTKRAHNLGAPLDFIERTYKSEHIAGLNCNYDEVVIDCRIAALPTIDEMCGWFNDVHHICVCAYRDEDGKFENNIGRTKIFDSREDAILDAINSVLTLLEGGKQ